MVSSIKFSG